MATSNIMEIVKTIMLIELLTTTVSASKIVVLLPLATPSHKMVFMPVVEELASRGHEITVVSPVNPKKEVHVNVKEIIIPETSYAFFTQDKQKWAKSPGLLQITTEIAERITLFRTMISTSCEHFFNDRATMDLLNEGKQFDLAIVSEFYNDCAHGAAYLLSDQVILFSTTVLFPWLPNQAPIPPSYVPNLYFAFTDRMPFHKRLVNFVYISGYFLWYRYFVQPVAQDLLTKYISEAPSLEEAHDKVSLILANVDPVLLSPRPMMPNTVAVGGTHCRSAQSLPKEYQEFADSSGEDGFILFSFGSILQCQFLPDQFINAFLTTFKRLKLKVMWKCDSGLQNVPGNIKITKWMPQQDLLGHPKIRLFITHGGLLSLQEAVYHAVPVIGIPVFGDQWGNLARVKQLGIGESLDPQNITTEEVYNTVTKVLNDKRYAENMKKYSSIVRDQPKRPLELAVFWIEYVIRHQGAPHFRSAGETLSFVQYFLLDVLAFILIIVVVVTWIAILFIKAVAAVGYKLMKKGDIALKKND